MSKSLLLRSLRTIALDHASSAHPDLASMARELGRAIHHAGPAPDPRLAALRQGPFRRWKLPMPGRMQVSMLVMAWPAGHVTPTHDHGGLWGLEAALCGALEVHSYARDDHGGLREQTRTWLGPGDAIWFDTDDSGVHRCRNLSRHEVALSLHVYGGALEHYRIYQPHQHGARWTTLPARADVAGLLTI